MIRAVIKKCLAYTEVFLFFLIILGVVKQFILTDEPVEESVKMAEQKAEELVSSPEKAQEQVQERIVPHQNDSLPNIKTKKNRKKTLVQNDRDEGERNSVHRAPGRVPGNPANPSRVAPIVTGTPSIPSASPPIVPSTALETVPSNAPELVVPQPPPGSTTQTVTTPQTQPIQKPSDQPQKNSEVSQESRSPDNTVTGPEVPVIEPKPEPSTVQEEPGTQPAPSSEAPTTAPTQPQFPSSESSENTGTNSSTETNTSNTDPESGKKQDWLRGYGGG